MWGKMDDKFHRNRKVRKLRKLKGGLEALGTWVFWWSWCLDDPELSGEVPKIELSRADERNAELLVDAELWERTDTGYRFHDFHAYNPTKQKVETKREADRKRLAEKRGASRTNVARDIECDNDATEEVSRVRVALARDPDPTRPDTTQERECARDPFGEPPESVTRTAFEADRATVRAEFSRRWQASGQPGLWSLATDPAVDKLTDWLRSIPGDLTEHLARTLDGFFADEWARAQHFPVRHLARFPERYFSPREGAKETVESLAAEIQQAVISGAVDKVPELAKRKRELEAARESGGRYAR